LTRAEALLKANELNVGNIIHSNELNFVFIAVKTRTLGKVRWAVQRYSVAYNKATFVGYVEEGY
jgi:hypothetical protein